ncbi:MAG: hypothetical protein ABIC57_02495, partial [bacterium]
RLLLLFIPALLLLSACVSTNVYPGEKEGREYQSQNTRVCETIKFECDEGQVPFNDYTGCGCDLIDGYEPEPVDEPSEEPEPVDELVDEPSEEPIVDIECGIVGDEQISCDEGMCAVVEGEDEARCVTDNFCDDYCEEGFDCVIMESYPVQIRCNEVIEEEEVVEEEEAVEEETVENINEESDEEEVVEEVEEDDSEWLTEEEIPEE